MPINNIQLLKCTNQEDEPETEPWTPSWQFPQSLHSSQDSKAEGMEGIQGGSCIEVPNFLPGLYLKICHFPLGLWLPAPSPIPTFLSDVWQCCFFSLLVDHIFYFLYSDALIPWGLAGLGGTAPPRGSQFLETCQVAGLSFADQPIQSWSSQSPLSSDSHTIPWPWSPQGHVLITRDRTCALEHAETIHISQTSPLSGFLSTQLSSLMLPMYVLQKYPVIQVNLPVYIIKYFKQGVRPSDLCFKPTQMLRRGMAFCT